MPKLSISPRSAFIAAPTSIRAAYAALITVAVLVAADGISGGSVLGLFGANGWSIAGGLLGGYLIADAGLLVLRARSLGRKLAYVVGALALVGGGFTVTGMMSGSLIAGIALIVLSAAVFITVSVPSSAAHFASRTDQPAIINTKRPSSKKTKSTAGSAPAAGSWAAIMEAEKAEAEKRSADQQ